jgi:hypothetical protein
MALIALSAGCALPRQPDASVRADEVRVVDDLRLGNLERAARYPWTDDGRCVVKEASNEWPVLAERCFHALDHDRVRFRDVTGKCAVAVAPAVAVGVGVCILAAAELAVEAVVVVGTVAAAAAIVAEIEAARARRRCTCFCVATGVFLGDGNVKVKDKAACQQYCWATYSALEPKAVCK